MHNSLNKRKYYVYILTNKPNGTLYVGVSGNLYSRVLFHQLKENKNAFTAKYRLDKLVYYETFKYANDAIKREKNIKKWKRLWKVRLIKEMNPEWEDLFKYFE